MIDVPEGYKQTEVGVIPKDWDVETLGDIFTFGGGYSASRDQLSSDGHCYLHYGDIHKSTKSFIDVRAEYPDIPKLNIPLKRVSPKSLLSDGDVVFVDASEDDEGTSKHIVVVNNEDITYISGLHTIVAKSKVGALDNGYKRYCFQSRDIKRQFYFYSVGTKVSGISKTNIGKLQFPLPPLPEQQAIASALSDMDALITALEQLITKKRNIKQGAMQQLLTGEKRLPGFSGEWEVKMLKEIADVRDGTHESPKYHKNGVIFITSKNIIDGKIDFTDINLISEDDATDINQRSKVDKGDILMSMIGTIGNAVLINFEPNFCIKNVALIKPSQVSGNYLTKFLQSPIFQKYLNENLDGGIQKFISLGGLRELNIPIPCPAEQQAIAQILSDMDTEIEALEQKQAKYKAIKQGMMQELLTGKTRLV